MRKFTVECKDNKTGYSMVLSECTYNMAMDWIWSLCKNYNIGKCATNKNTGLIEIELCAEIGINKYKHIRTFYYDEERGYLLGE